MTEAFLHVHREHEITPQATIERVILLYDKTSCIHDVTEARQHLFTKKQRSLESLPPTREALLQHLKRAAYQGAIIWGQCMISNPQIPKPDSWG